MKKIAILSVLVSLGFGMAACDEEGESGSLINCNNYPNSKAAFTSMIKATDSCDAVQSAEQNFYDTANAENFPDSDLAKSECVAEWLTAQTTEDANKALDAWNGFGNTCKSDMIDVVKPILQETVGKMSGGSQQGGNDNKPAEGKNDEIKCDDYSKTKTEFLAAAKLDGTDCEAFKAAADKLKTAAVEEKVMSSASDDEGLGKVLSACYEKWGATKDQKDAFDKNSKAECGGNPQDSGLKCDELTSTKEKLLAAIASDGSDCKAHNQLVVDFATAASDEKVMSSADDAEGLANLVSSCFEAWEITEEQFKSFRDKTKACASAAGEDEKIKCGDYTKTPKAIKDAIKLDDKHCDDLKTAVDAIAAAAAEENLISSADKTDDLKKAIDACASDWKITKDQLDSLEKVKTSCASQQGGDNDDIKCDDLNKTKTAFLTVAEVKKDECDSFKAGMTTLLREAASEKAISSDVDAVGLDKVLHACVDKWKVTQDQVDNYNANMSTCYASSNVKCEELSNTKNALQKVVEASDKECSDFTKAMGELQNAASAEKAIASEADIEGLNSVIASCWQSWNMTAEQIQKINDKSKTCLLPSNEIKCNDLPNTKAEALKLIKIDDSHCADFNIALLALLNAAKNEKAIESLKDMEEMAKVIGYCYSEWGVSDDEVSNYLKVLQKCAGSQP